MGDTDIRKAERFLAEGDYVRALDELRKAAPGDDHLARMIQTAVGRMKLIAAREFVVGRWSVAEGIFDAVRDYHPFLTPEERSECKMLVKEIQRCRDNEKALHGVFQAAAQFAAEGQFPRSREVALRAMSRCTDLHLVARLRRLLMSLPHPLGKLVYGFDSTLEAQQFARPIGGAEIDTVLDESHELGGGFAWLKFGGRGAGIALLDPPPDWSDYKEISLLVRLNVNVLRPDRVKVKFQLLVGDLNNAYEYEATVSDQGWCQLRIPLAEFRKRGEPKWESVTCLSLMSSADTATEFFLDEIRLKPRRQSAAWQATT